MMENRDYPHRSTGQQSSLPNSLRSLLYERPISATRGPLAHPSEDYSDPEEADWKGGEARFSMQRTPSAPSFPSTSGRGFYAVRTPRTRPPMEEDQFEFEEDSRGGQDESGTESEFMHEPSGGLSTSSRQHGSPPIDVRAHSSSYATRNLNYIPRTRASYPPPDPALYSDPSRGMEYGPPTIQPSRREWHLPPTSARDLTFDSAMQTSRDQHHMRSPLDPYHPPLASSLYPHYYTESRSVPISIEASYSSNPHRRTRSPSPPPDPHWHSRSASFTSSRSPNDEEGEDDYDHDDHDHDDHDENDQDDNDRYDGDFQAGPARKALGGARKRKKAQTSSSAMPAGASGEQQRKRRMFKKTEIACEFCRGRKLRCDGAKPICSTCAARKNTEPCLYQTEPKRRGPGKAPKGNRTKLQVKTKAEDVPSSMSSRSRQAPGSSQTGRLSIMVPDHQDRDTTMFGSPNPLTTHTAMSTGTRSNSTNSPVTGVQAHTRPLASPQELHTDTRKRS